MIITTQRHQTYQPPASSQAGADQSKAKPLGRLRSKWVVEDTRLVCKWIND
ncbi:MAG: hypothetical protein AAFN18_08965 [Cyanobacteria bacterium J06554_6]